MKRRKSYLDWIRGVAVLVMIEAHALDAWTRGVERSTTSFRNLLILGGFAAPLFLWLAGIAGVLAADSALRRSTRRGDAAARVCRRGLEIFILAFLFRLQAFVVSPGGSVLSLFRVDILNVMGPSLVGVALLWWSVRNRAAAVAMFAAVATATAMLTPLVRVAPWVNALPIWIQWYVRPAGEFTNFTMFPWCGFVFGGAAVGLLLTAGAERWSDGRRQKALAIAGSLVLAFGFYCSSRPSMYQSSSFWTSSPAYFAIRCGVLLLGGAAAYGIERAVPTAKAMLSPLERLGRESLFVYWVHVELVYGYATWPIHGRLWLWETASVYLVFVAFIYLAVLARERIATAWLSRRKIPPSPQPLSI